ncbi:MAG: ABC transporter permease subunit [Candidatus Hydrogenedentota bacterium]
MMFPSTAIIRRDLLRAARQKRTFVWVLLLVSITSFLVIASWPGEHQYYFRGGRIAQNIIVPSIMTWMFAVMILVTPYAATSIVLERQRETFDLVRATRIWPLGFVFAQLFSVLALQLILLLTTLPVVASIYFLVGLELRNLLLGVGMVLVVMVSCAVMGLYASAKSQTVLTAFVRAYLYAFVVMGGLVLVGGIVLDAMGIYHLGGRFEHALAVACPAFAGIAASIGETGSELVVASAIIQSVIILIGLGLIYWNIRRPDSGESRFWELLLSGLLWPFRRARLPKKRIRMIEDFSNPVYVKDTRFAGRSHRYVLRGLNLLLFGVATLIGVTAFLVCFESQQPARPRVTTTWVIFMWFAFGLIAPLTTATSIANEYELGNLDMLRITRLRGAQVLWGKFLAGCRMLLPAFIVFWVWCFLLMQLQPGSRGGGALVTGFVSACLTGLLGASMGILASSFAKTSTRAVIWAYVLTAWVVLLMWLAGAASYAMLSELRIAPGRNHPFTKSVYETVVFLSPPLAYIWNLEERSRPQKLYTFYWSCHVAFSVVFNFLIVFVASLKMTSRWQASKK